MNWADLDPGELRDRVTLYSPTYNDAGDQIEGWASEGSVWANVQDALVPVSGNRVEQPQSGREITIHEATITVRYRSDITETWQIQHGASRYDIRDIRNISGVNVRLDLTCRRVK